MEILACFRSRHARAKTHASIVFVRMMDGRVKPGHDEICADC
jgi:hypothetical protein